MFFEAFQAIGEQVGRDPFERFEQRREAAAAPGKVTKQEDRPTVADDIERAGDGAGLLEFVVAWLGQRGSPLSD
ncbi:MAG: hypothetical protein AB7T37_03060 [Dehalococcoidia bacterium]